MDVSAIYHCAVAPAAAAAYMSETKVAGAVAELLHAEDVSPFHYNTRGWRKEIHLFMLKSAQGYLLRSLTGLDVGHNLNAKSVFRIRICPKRHKHRCLRVVRSLAPTILSPSPIAVW